MKSLLCKRPFVLAIVDAAFCSRLSVREETESSRRNEIICVWNAAWVQPRYQDFTVFAKEIFLPAFGMIPLAFGSVQMSTLCNKRSQLTWISNSGTRIATSRRKNYECLAARLRISKRMST